MLRNGVVVKVDVLVNVVDGEGVIGEVEGNVESFVGSSTKCLGMKTVGSGMACRRVMGEYPLGEGGGRVGRSGGRIPVAPGNQALYRQEDKDGNGEFPPSSPGRDEERRGGRGRVAGRDGELPSRSW